MITQVEDATIQQLTEQAETDGIQKKVVGAVIKRQDGKFLLLERVPSDFMGGLVELPSGTVDPGETLTDALTREVREETSLVVSNVLRYVGSFDYTSGSGKKTRQFNFLVEIVPDEVVLNPSEHCAHYWLGLSDDDFLSLNISESTKSILINVNQD